MACSRSHSRSHSRSRRRHLRGGNHGGEVPAPAQITGYVTPGVSALTPFAGGSRRRGGSALADIAIPAVFIAANNLVGVKRTTGKSMKKRRGNRVRFSRRRR